MCVGDCGPPTPLHHVGGLVFEAVVSKYYRRGGGGVIGGGDVENVVSGVILRVDVAVDGGPWSEGRGV